jgi:hypothetical protein
MSTSSKRVGNATWLRYAFRMPHAYNMPIYDTRMHMPHAYIRYTHAHAYIGYDNVIRLLALLGR